MIDSNPFENLINQIVQLSIELNATKSLRPHTPDDYQYHDELKQKLTSAIQNAKTQLDYHIQPLQYIQIVEELNAILYQQSGDNCQTFFTYTSRGFDHSIAFGDVILWYDENDERKFDEESNQYEPLLPFVVKQFNKLVKQFKRITL